MKLIFADAAWDGYLHRQANALNTLQRFNDLIKECQRTPFKGTGKPEPLKGDLKGRWSLSAGFTIDVRRSRAARIEALDRKAQACAQNDPVLRCPCIHDNAD